MLWTMAAQERVTVFGTSAKYLALAEKEGLTPRSTHDLSALRTILSTGSPLAGHSYDYVYDAIKPDVHLCNISAGRRYLLLRHRQPDRTRVARGAAGPWARHGGGRRWADRPAAARGGGELVCTKPFPSMPVAFWNDPAGLKYRATYFERFPGVWRQGDWPSSLP